MWTLDIKTPKWEGVAFEYSERLRSFVVISKAIRYGDRDSQNSRASFQQHENEEISDFKEGNSLSCNQVCKPMRKEVRRKCFNTSEAVFNR